MTKQVKIAFAALQAMFVLAIIVGVRNQVSEETQVTVRRNRAIAQALGKHAGEFFAARQDQSGEFSLRELNAFLAERLGRGKLFDEGAGRAESFEVYRLQDLKLGRIRPEILDSVDFSEPYTIRDDGSTITVTVPFALTEKASSATETADDYYGIVRIPAHRARIYRALLERNAALYLTVGFLFAAQLILGYLLMLKRRREIIFERGYLREHALGALKLQRQILDGIIQDHEGAGPREFDEFETDSGEADDGSKVVRLFDDRGGK
ncbi:MAG: hypothetical protein KDH09_05185 [Chrysiogenetes bacterium]|nr:hypothetical protein [Chrysiogenetes bacterium]